MIFASSISKIANDQEREEYYREVMANGNLSCQDNLYNRITAKVGLNEQEKKELLEITTKGCRINTYNAIKRTIENLPYNIKNCGIFERIHFDKYGVSYCAGQDYREEMKILRSCLK